MNIASDGKCNPPQGQTAHEMPSQVATSFPSLHRERQGAGTTVTLHLMALPVFGTLRRMYARPALAQFGPSNCAHQPYQHSRAVVKAVFSLRKVPMVTFIESRVVVQRCR
jgi:hypothetical protein